MMYCSLIYYFVQQHLTYDKVEAVVVLPNINRTQAAERAKNAVFIHGDLDL